MPKIPLREFRSETNFTERSAQREISSAKRISRVSSSLSAVLADLSTSRRARPSGGNRLLALNCHKATINYSYVSRDACERRIGNVSA